MLNGLIRFSLRHRALVLAIAIFALVAGWIAGREMPLDVLPELTKPVVTVLTESGTLAPEEVETRVTRPLESALMGLPQIDRLRSTSDTGLSLVFVEFEWGTSLPQARLLVQERILTASAHLPEHIRPQLTPSTSLLGEILLIGLSSPDGTIEPPELRAIADTTVRRRLQAVPGVADVLSMGGGIRQVHVVPDPRKLAAHELTIEEVQAAVANASGDSTAGTLFLNSREMPVRALGLSTDLAELRRVPVRIEEDHVVLLGDIARVEYDVSPPRGEASIHGRPGVILSVDKAPGADTLAVTAGVERTFAELKTQLPPGTELTVLFRQGDFIESSIRTLRHVVRDGAIIVALVLFVFLLRLRPTLIALSAIPLSFAVSVLVFRWMGATMNPMLLGGLAVAIGMVVDDAIVDVENVFRRWRENARLPKPRPLLEVVASASGEVRHGIFFATVLVLLAFLPLAALPGLEGQLFLPVAIATCVSIVASFVVSLTVIPVLCSLVLPWGRPDSGPSFIARHLGNATKRFALPLAFERPFLLLGIVSVAIAAAVALASTLPRSFLPPFRETNATITLVSPPGTSLHAAGKLGEIGATLLRSIPEIRSVSRRTGRAEHDDHIVPVSITEYDVEFQPGARPRAEVDAEIRAKLAGIPGTFAYVGAPIAHRLAHMLSGTTGKLAIKVFGEDLDEVQRTAGHIAEAARATPGLADVFLEPLESTPRVNLALDRERTLAYGLAPLTVSQQVGDLLTGRVMAHVQDGERTLDLLVRLAAEWTDTPEELASLPIRTPGGQLVPLRALGEIREGSGPGVIQREDGMRRAVVTANAPGGDWPAVVEALDRSIRERVALPPGISYRLDGEYAAQEAATRRMLLLAGAVFISLALLLCAYFRGAVLAAQVMINVPLALVGGVALSWVVVGEITIATLVGFIAVGGVAARNGILMISHYLHLMRHEGEKFDRAMVVRGTLDRLPPVLMTALSAAVALLPLVFAADAPGKELLHPVAVVIVGGLVTGTLLDVLLTPAIFYHFGRRAAARALERGALASN